jgi:hypothetical protein
MSFAPPARVMGLNVNCPFPGADARHPKQQPAGWCHLLNHQYWCQWYHTGQYQRHTSMSQQFHLDRNRLTSPPLQSRVLKNVRDRGEKDNDGLEEAYEVSARKRQLEASDSNGVEGPYEGSTTSKSTDPRTSQTSILRPYSPSTKAMDSGSF